MYQKVTLRESVHMRYLHQDKGLQLKDVQKLYPSHTKTTIFRHMNKPILSDLPDGRHGNKGRPRKLSPRNCRKLNTSLLKLREDVGDFYSTDVQREAGMEHVSNRTVRRALKMPAYGYKFTQCRKKGQLVKPDLTKRLRWARRCAKLPASTWTTGISFYLDGTSWAHKTNPSRNTRTGRTRTWKRPKESLTLHCTAKGKKEGVGGKIAKFMVAIAHGRGVIGCHHYTGPMDGLAFAEMIDETFPLWHASTVDTTQRNFLQDGDPAQNSAVARDSWEQLQFELFSIPPRSPDLNPIENIFHLIGNKLKADAQAIQKETFAAFCHRAKQTILNFDKDIIDRTIESMPRRIAAVIEGKGARTKY